MDKVTVVTQPVNSPTKVFSKNNLVVYVYHETNWLGYGNESAEFLSVMSLCWPKWK